MTSYDRVMNKLKGQPVDKIPNMNITMAFAANFIGASYKVLVESKIAVSAEFDVDIVSVISDPMREASGFGVEVIIPENGVPYSQNYLIDDLSLVKDLKIANPLECERMKLHARPKAS